MRVRFTGTVCFDPVRTPGLAGQFNPGEEADLPEAIANQVLGAGFAQRIPPVEPPRPRAVEAAPVDRMTKREESRRKTVYREG